MKKIRKIMALVIASIMVLALAAPAMAAETPRYKIKIDNAVIGETYSAYKVFDVTYSNPVDPAPVAPAAATTIPGAPDTTHKFTAYAYTIKKDEGFWSDFTTGKTAATDGSYDIGYGLKFVPTSDANVYNVVPSGASVTAENMTALAEFLAGKLTGKTPAKAAKALGDKATSSDYTLVDAPLELDVTDAGAGYYFVDTTTGALCSLDTTEPEALIREKNSIPGEDKKVSDAADGAFGSDTTVKIGDTVYFKIEVTDSKGTDKAVTVHDTMDNAITLDIASFAVKVDNAAVSTDNYTITVNNAATIPTKGTNAAANFSKAAIADGCTFEIVFNDSYIQSLGENKVIVITYEGELNQNAVTADPFQTNKTTLKYSEQNTVEKEVTVKTYEVDIVKTDGNHKVLDGATFNIYDAATDGNKYNLVLVSEGNYRLATSDDAAASYATKLTPKDGKLNIKGLENGTYYLEEVDHPEGYNPLTERKPFTINNANSNAILTGEGKNAVYDSATANQAGVEVVNQSGTELPSTGGIGTTIFYVLGAVLVIGAGVLLVTRRRMNND